MDYRKNTTNKKQKQLDSKKTMKKKRRGVRWFKIFALICVIGLFVAALTSYLLVSHIVADLPDITPEDVSPTGYTTFILDQDGNELEKLVQAGSNRVYVYLEDIPEDLQNAFIAIEDSRFYTHNGIDVKGILRATLVGVTSGNLSEGASTITQQLIKNTVFTNFTEEKTLWDRVSRKVQEIFLAVKLETAMTKDEILENYLNIINLGQNSLGAQAAAQRYFGKDVTDLTLSECSIIAGITKNPTGYNPINYPENNEARRDKVLGDMITQGYITEEQKAEAQADNAYERIQEINTSTTATYNPYSYFTDALIDQVKDDLQVELGYSPEQATSALYSGGLRIYSTQDMAMQAIADEEMSDNNNYPSSIEWAVDLALTVYREDGETDNYSVQMFDKWAISSLKKSTPVLFSSEAQADEAINKYKASLEIKDDETILERISITPQPQASFVLMDQYTGEVKVLVGGRGEKEQSLSLNRASNTTRQPGSTFKIVSTYAPALDLDQYTLASTLSDSAFKYTGTDQTVTNSYSGYTGSQTVRTAIKKSINTIAVRALTAITPQAGYDYLEEFGFTTLVESDINQAMALGGLTYGVTNLELTASYATIANDGTYIEPILYTKITDSRGKLLIDNTPETRDVIDDSTAALLTSAMQDVVKSGTGTRASLGSQPVAGKTGTTNDYKDIWFVGYTPYYTAGIWGGYDQPVAMNSSTASWRNTLWANIMKRVHDDLPVKSFDIPSSINKTTRCSITGCLAISSKLTTLTDTDGSSYEAYISCPTRTEYFKSGTYNSTTCNGVGTGHITTRVTPPVVEVPVEDTVIEDAVVDTDTNSNSNDSSDNSANDSTDNSTNTNTNTDNGTNGGTGNSSNDSTDNSTNTDNSANDSTPEVNVDTTTTPDTDTPVQ